MAFKLDRYKMLIREFSNWHLFLVSKLTKPTSFSFIRRDGFRIEVPKTFQSAFKENFFDQSYWRGFPSLISKEEPLNILDIGGNVGYFGLYAMSRYKKAKVHSFEPIPFNYRVMDEYKNAYQFDRWTLHNKAISDSIDPLTLYASREDGFCLMAAPTPTDLLRYKFEIEATTPSQFMTDERIDKLDLVKIDCEGSEYPILYSWKDADFDKVDRLAIESHPNNKAGYNHKSLVKFLEEKGYTTDDNKEGDGTGYIWAWRS